MRVRWIILIDERCISAFCQIYDLDLLNLMKLLLFNSLWWHQRKTNPYGCERECMHVCEAPQTGNGEETPGPGTPPQKLCDSRQTACPLEPLFPC